MTQEDEKENRVYDDRRYLGRIEPREDSPILDVFDAYDRRFAICLDPDVAARLVREHMNMPPKSRTSTKNSARRRKRVD